MSTIPAIGVALALVVSVSVVPPQAQDREITYDKPTSQTSTQELTELVVAEYRTGRAARNSSTRTNNPPPST